MLWAIWDHLYNLKNVKNTHGGMFLLIKVAGFRSSHQRCSVKKGVLRNVAKFTGKHLRQSLFFNKSF